MFTPAKFGRGNGRGQTRMVAPPRGGAGAGAIAPRNRGAIAPARLGTGTPPSACPPQNTQEENFNLLPGTALPFAMIIKLVPDLVEEVKRVEAEGGKVQIKLGPYANNPSGNVIDVGGKEFTFTWAPEPGELCDIYEEQQSGEDGNGVLVESGSAWRKLNVQRTLDDTVRDHVKMRSAEAARQLKSRKAIILDHGNPVVKAQAKSVAPTAGDANARKLPVKMKKEPPPKKRKTEASSAVVAPTSDAVKSGLSQPVISLATNSKSTTSPVSSPLEQPDALPQPPIMQTGSAHPPKGHVIVDEAVTRRPSSKPDPCKQKDKTHNLASTSVSEGGSQKKGVGSAPTDLRSLLIMQLMENPKGMTIKAIEKAIGLPNCAKKIDTMIKAIATYQAPGRYILKPGVEKESFMKSSPGSGSSPECPPVESPLAESSPLSEKAIEPIDEQQAHSTPKQELELNIDDKIDVHLHESPDATANQKKTINSEGSGSSSSSESGSDSESDSGSSDSGSDSGSQSRSRSRSRSKSKSKSPAGSGSGSSSESDSEGSSSSSEGSDVHVDIMSDDEKSDKEEEIQQKLRVKDSSPTPSHVDRDEFGESYEQKDTVEEKDDAHPPPSTRNSEDVDICDDTAEGEEISKIAQHYVEKVTSDGEDDPDMAVDIDVIHCEGEVKSPEDRITISPKHSRQKESHSPIGTDKSLQGTPDEKENATKENSNEEDPRKPEKTPKSVSKHGRDIDQSQTASGKIKMRQNSKAWIEKKEEMDSDARKNRDVTSSQHWFESPARPEISSNRKDFDMRQIAKESSKGRFTDATSEKALQHVTPFGRSVRDEDTIRQQASAEGQPTFLKDLDDVERFEQHPDGQQSYQKERGGDASSRAKASDALQRSGRHVDSSNKINKQHDRQSRSANEIDISAAKSSNLEEKNSRYEQASKSVPDEDVMAKEKFNTSSKFVKENGSTERFSRVIDSQFRKAGEQNGRQPKDAGSSGRPFLSSAPKDNKKAEMDKRQFHTGKESALKREYSDLELGEFREPVSEEEPQEPKSRFEKLQASRGMDTKVKSGVKSESASPDVAKGHSIGKAVPELKKSSPSEPSDDFTKHDVRIGKRMMEDGSTDSARPLKKPMLSQARQPPYSDHADLEPSARQERVVETHAKAVTAEMIKASPSRGPEAQVGAYRKTPTSNLQKPDYRVRVQEVTACDNKDTNAQKTKGNTNPVEKRKQSTRGENNLIQVKKKSASSDEGQAFYAKYEKDKAELRGPIKNTQQFKEYIREFQEKYSCYHMLNTALESDKEDFQKLERDLQSAKDKGDTKTYATISEQVKKAYSQCASRHKRMKKIFIVLHEELKNLKQRAMDFEARYV
eukprot:Gb_28958 [translate_table: standard]